MTIKEISEVEYREIKRNSSSSLKDFSLDRRKYQRKYILGETIKEKPNKASDMGRLVETLLMEPERFDELFFMSSLASVPGGMLGDFIYFLSEEVSKYEHEELTDEEFAISTNIAHKKSGFKHKLPTVLKKLDDPENELYYSECLRVNKLGMTMVTPQDIDNAEQIVKALKTNRNTANIVNLETNKDFTVINQMKIDGYQIDGLLLKSMLDKVIINHITKTITPFDLKCTWSVENFFKEYYLFRRTYIQAYLYKRAIIELTENPESIYHRYSVENTTFIVCDSINYYDPLIYTLSEDDMRDAYLGFTHKYTYYPGVKDIIEDLHWAIDKDMWGISKRNFEKKGILNIKD